MRSIFLSFFLLLALCACGPGPTLLNGHYTGVVAFEEGAEVWVAAAVTTGYAAVFLAGQDELLSSHSRFLVGPVEDPPNRFFVESEGWSVDMRPDGLDLIGLVTADDASTFNIRLTQAATSVEGLYHAMDDGCRLGVVVHRLEESQSPQGRGVWCNQGGGRKAVTVDDTSANPMTVTVDVDGDSRSFELEKANASKL